MLEAKLVPPALMAGDLGVVNAARVSFNRMHEKIEAKDPRLIKFLAREGHWSPFAHPQLVFKQKMSLVSLGLWALKAPIGLRLFQDPVDCQVYYVQGSLYAFIKNQNVFDANEHNTILQHLHDRFPHTADAFRLPRPGRERGGEFLPLGEEPVEATTATFRITAPIFVARQLGKHQVGLTWNEVSRRYVDYEPDFYIPEHWRKRPADGIKQGSSDETIPLNEPEASCFSDYLDVILTCDELYADMLRRGVAPEMARMVLPQSMKTQWFWTGSLEAFARVCRQRLDPHAQQETRQVAEQINAALFERHGHLWADVREVEARNGS